MSLEGLGFEGLGLSGCRASGFKGFHCWEGISPHAVFMGIKVLGSFSL